MCPYVEHVEDCKRKDKRNIIIYSVVVIVLVVVLKVLGF